MNGLDWAVVGVYLAGMLGMAAWFRRGQAHEKDYYLAGNRLPFWAIGLSTMATQCSTNSLLGAPAFVIAVGGLLWLQYELAVPLAMIGVMLFLLPFFRHRGVVSVYEYLEHRFGPGSRTLLSVLFQFLRAFSTGVTVYGISLVIQRLLGIPFWAAVLVLGVVTVIYDFLGGMKAVIWSDVIQMVVLYTGIIICFFYALPLVGGWTGMWAAFPAEQARTLDFSGHGLGDGQTFAFWPMLIGGFFLYMSYYGCDQTQVQRELSSRSEDDSNRSLFLNGVLRFPLVVTYCLVGVAIGAYAVLHPGWTEALVDPMTGEPNYNLAVPVFCLQNLPHGVIGLIVIALFAAAMSSLDSTINSLSAVTMRDLVERFRSGPALTPGQRLRWARYTTLLWGAVCMAFSFVVGGISASIIESINMIGSLINGPILATFLLAILTRRARDAGVVIGIICGFGTNLYLWIFQPGVSWLWWNAFGCAVTFGVGYVASLVLPGKAPDDLDNLVFSRDARKRFGYRRNWTVYYAVLVVYFVVMLGVLVMMNG